MFIYTAEGRYCYRCLHSHYTEHNGGICLYCRKRHEHLGRHALATTRNSEGKAESCEEYMPNYGPAFEKALREWRSKSHH